MRHSWTVRARAESQAAAVGVAAVLLAGALGAAAGGIAGVLPALAALLAAPVLGAARRGPDDGVGVAAEIHQKEPGERVWPNAAQVRSLLCADAVAAEDNGCRAGL